MHQARIPTETQLLSIPKPCSESWGQMTGDEQKRFCERCSLHVYNLRTMPKSEVEELLAKNENVCVRAQLKSNGAIMTQDDPSLPSRQKTGFFKTIAASMIAALGLLSSCSSTEETPPTETQHQVDIRNHLGKVDPRVQGLRIREQQGEGRMLMGRVRQTP